MQDSNKLEPLVQTTPRSSYAIVYELRKGQRLRKYLHALQATVNSISTQQISKYSIWYLFTGSSL